jgi:hypothetical protein
LVKVAFGTREHAVQILEDCSSARRSERFSDCQVYVPGINAPPAPPMGRTYHTMADITEWARQYQSEGSWCRQHIRALSALSASRKCPGATDDPTIRQIQRLINCAKRSSRDEDPKNIDDSGSILLICHVRRKLTNQLTNKTNSFDIPLRSPQHGAWIDRSRAAEAFTLSESQRLLTEESFQQSTALPAQE